MLRRRIASALAIVAALSIFLASPSSAQTSEEAVKAAFLYRFASFVSWPQSVFASEQTPIQICVMGAGAFSDSLRQAVQGQRVDGRQFEVRMLADQNGAEACQIVYVAGDNVDETLRALRGRPILTVTDGTLGRGSTRGIIHFVIVDDRVRFHIDDARAAESHLTLSSRLLSLAVSVRRRILS